MPNERVKFQVEGLDRIQRMMERLPERNQRKIKRGALRKGSRVVVLAIREEVKKIPSSALSESGKTRYAKSIGTETQKDRRHDAGTFIGARYKGVQNTFPESHLFELGTGERRTKDGQERGRIEPQPAIRRGWEKSRTKAVDTTRTEMVDRTVEEADKLMNR